jgi:soluble lytic murein transglycosylase-like protein
MSPIQLQTQLTNAEKLGIMPDFRDASQATGVPLPFLLAIASRESHIGSSILLRNWIGDNGWAHGIMQIDIRWHPNFTNNHRPDDHRANIMYGANYLARHYAEFRNWKHTASAYNAGAGNTRAALANGQDPDSRTTGKNYGQDVLNRAEIIKDLLPAEIEQGVTTLLAISGIATLYYFDLIPIPKSS